jgi:hypothetical protein
MFPYLVTGIPDSIPASACLLLLGHLSANSYSNECKKADDDSTYCLTKPWLKASLAK